MVCHDLPTDSKMSDSTPANLAKLISSAKILMVGAGGIGCELLKNLVLTGFKDIVVVSFVHFFQDFSPADLGTMLPAFVINLKERMLY